MTGTIRVLKQNAFGFIRGDDGVDYFFHRSGLQMTTCTFEELGVGQEVTFSRIEGPTNKGPRAIEIRVVS